MMRRAVVLLSVAATLMLCAAPNARADEEIIVSAASSLARAFKDVARTFEAKNPGVRVALNLASSGVLANQIAQGAPVDVFASADEATMDMAADKGLIVRTSRADFASNRLVLIVPADAVVGPVTADDLLAPGIKTIAVGKPSTVPAGRYAKEALKRGGLWDRLGRKFIYSDSVRQVLDYVRRGEVDAGIVYKTDAMTEKGKVLTVCELPVPGMAIVYPAAVVAGSSNRALGARFIEFMLSDAGRKILSGYGFGPAGGRR